MLPFTNFTFGSIVNTVCRGDCVVAGLSIVVLMMLCRETPPKIFLSCFVGESVVCSDWLRGAALAAPEKASAPITPTRAPIRYLRLRIPLRSFGQLRHLCACTKNTFRGAVVRTRKRCQPSEMASIGRLGPLDPGGPDSVRGTAWSRGWAGDGDRKAGLSWPVSAWP